MPAFNQTSFLNHANIEPQFVSKERGKIAVKISPKKALKVALYNTFNLNSNTKSFGSLFSWNVDSPSNGFQVAHARWVCVHDHNLCAVVMVARINRARHRSVTGGLHNPLRKRSLSSVSLELEVGLLSVEFSFNWGVKRIHSQRKVFRIAKRFRSEVCYKFNY